MAVFQRDPLDSSRAGCLFVLVLIGAIGGCEALVKGDYSTAAKFWPLLKWGSIGLVPIIVLSILLRRGDSKKNPEEYLAAFRALEAEKKRASEEKVDTPQCRTPTKSTKEKKGRKKSKG